MSKAFAFIIVVFIIASCGNSVQKTPAKKVKVVSDLEAIIQKDTLTVLTENGAISFYEYKDKYLGFEYEILDSFARHLGVHLKLIEISNPNDFVAYLNSGRGDLIACNKPIHMEDKKLHAFSIPYNPDSKISFIMWKKTLNPRIMTIGHASIYCGFNANNTGFEKTILSVKSGNAK